MVAPELSTNAERATSTRIKVFIDVNPFRCQDRAYNPLVSRSQPPLRSGFPLVFDPDTAVYQPKLILVFINRA